jgi:hypothetical protein
VRGPQHCVLPDGKPRRTPKRRNGILVVRRHWEAAAEVLAVNYSCNLWKALAAPVLSMMRQPTWRLAPWWHHPHAVPGRLQRGAAPAEIWAGPSAACTASVQDPVHCSTAVLPWQLLPLL